MALIFNNLLRPPQIEETCEQFEPRAKQREFTINPDGSFLDIKDLATALRRASPWDRICLPEGEHIVPEIRKSLSLRGLPNCTVIKGPLRVTSDYLLLAGLEIYAPVGQPAILLEGGTLLLEDCTIKGEIKVSPTSNLFMRNCLAGRAEEAISATDHALIEIHSSRISDCKIGVSLRRNAACALYHCRIDHCLRPDAGDSGSAIYAENAKVYAEGVTLVDNNVGIYLKDCPDTRFLSCHFLDHKAASIISTGRPADRLTLCACRIECQESARGGQIAFNGGTLAVIYSKIQKSPGPALTFDQGRLEISHSRLSSEASSALEAQSCEFSGDSLICEASTGTALSAIDCKGEIRKGTFIGHPPVTLQESPELQIKDGESLEPSSMEPNSKESTSPTHIQHFLQNLTEVVRHEIVRTELERLLRLAHAAQQRRLAGLPVPEQNFHAIFTGATGTGKLAAARVLAEGFFTFGATSEPGVQEFDLSSFKAKENGHGPFPPENLTGKVFFLSARRATGFTTDLKPIQEILDRLVKIPQAVLILEGDRDEMRRLIRGDTALERAFSRFIHFPTYGPVELTALFCQRCLQDRIPVSQEAALCCLLLFHVHCDRKDRRFTTVEGVLALYEAARQRYLERCSHQNRFDLELERQDLDLPPDKNFRVALERSPAFATFCPSCRKENAWVIGADEQMICLHCGTPYAAPWGLWKESASYRRAREQLMGVVVSGAISRRVRAPGA